EAADLEWARVEGGSDQEEWECVACGKSFRSEAAWDSHERSKKHLKAVEQLRQEMQEEGEELGLNGGEDETVVEEARQATEPPRSVTPEEPEAAGTEPPTPNHRDEEEEEDAASAPARKKKRSKAKKKSPTASPAAEDDTREPAMPGSFPDARPEAGPRPDDEAALSDTNGDADLDGQPQPSKKEKRRAREAAKKAKDGDAKTTVFESRTKLFAHINETGHALASSEGNGASVTGKKKGKKGKRMRATFVYAGDAALSQQI
ncbi:hypothetical protein EWM64_g9494, partial [Hericium alpestre]